MEQSEENSVATLGCCTECGREWSNRREWWKLHLTDDDPPQAMLYCPDCAARELHWPGL